MVAATPPGVVQNPAYRPAHPPQPVDPRRRGRRGERGALLESRNWGGT